MRGDYLDADGNALIKKISINVKDYTPDWKAGAGGTYFWYVANWTSLGITPERVIAARFGTWGGFSGGEFPMLMTSASGVALVSAVNTWTCTSLEIIISYV